MLIETHSGDRTINTLFTLPAAMAADVLDPSFSFTLTVTDPNGGIVKDTSGTALNSSVDAGGSYRFVMDKYGDYTISYTSADTRGNRAAYSYGITIVDSERPVIELSGGDRSAKVGKRVSLASANVFDNLTASPRVAVCVQDPDGVFFSVSDGAFTPAAEGIYRVMYMAEDESGNAAFASYTVTVTEK
jgi:hypothetical protein